MSFLLRGVSTLATLTTFAALVGAPGEANFRKPKDDADLRYWLENMVWHHQFTDAEIAAATGLTKGEIAAALKKFDISAATKPRRPADAPLLVLPYPGGRHPRIGFLEGAIRPQRETKVSVFPPWDGTSYVVVDVPEALFTNLGLTYLAHTHVPTIWEKQKIDLEKLEWNRRADGTLDLERRLPNGIVFGTKIVPGKTEVRLELWLRNGTKEKLTNMRVQNCVLLKGAKGFEAQSNDNKVFAPPYAACKSADGKRWVITAWEPHQRSWGNVKCPCLHSDPRIPDCAPGETQRLRGWLSFYEGDDSQAEFRRVDRTGWRVSAPSGARPVQVFILAGQSNMEGQAVVDLDGKNYNDGKGTLKTLMNDATKAPLLRHLKNDKGEWTVRNDVWVRYQREKQPLLAGPLSIGFSIYGGKHHFGPELQFGHVVGDHVRGQVLLIKTAWGGKSLYKDFRPPSSGGEVGPYYKKMLAEVRLGLDNLKTDFPAYRGQGYEFAGFVWYQGWNDGVDPKNAVPQYEENLVNLIKDVRKALNAPKLPVVIGELTGPWVDAPGAWAALRKAQANAANRPEFKGNVIFVETRHCVRPAKDSPNPTHGHHEFGNAETYFLVGDALGKGMVKLLATPAK
jgi:hypothetical protein